MNRIAVNIEEGVSAKACRPDLRKSLSAYTLKVLKHIELDNWDLSILICTDETIKALNTQYRNIPEPTDVLSFELGAQETCPDGSIRFIPGDIVISLDSLQENARYYKISDDEELRRLLIHGILHLKGMDHKTNDAGEAMIIFQEDILKALKGEHIFLNPDLMHGGNK